MFLPRHLAAVLVLVALVAAACGGSDSSSAEPAPTATAPSGADAGEQGGEEAQAAEPAEEGEPSAPTGSGPQVGDHWHAAYGLYVCDSFTEPIADQSDPEGIHTHGDGVIHIHPFLDSAAGENATIGKFFEALQVEVTDTGFVGPGGSLEEGIECADGPAEFVLARWSLFDLDAPPAIVDTNIRDVRFVEDLEVFTIGFVAAGTDLPLPPSLANLGRISDVEPEDVPELPPGFTVAVVDPPEPGDRIDGPTACPALDGSSPRVTEFSERPPMCLDPDLTYTATFVTNYGEVVVELDTDTTPETVNNFVVLALYGYYDDTQLFRTAPSIDIVQGGAPHTNSNTDPGPGYTIADEGDGFSYLPGDLAMARTPAPDSASAQFFFSAGPATANLDGPPGNEDGSGRGTYVRFGTTVEGLDVLETIIALHVEDPALGGGGPGEPVILETVLVEAS